MTIRLFGNKSMHCCCRCCWYRCRCCCCRWLSSFLGNLLARALFLHRSDDTNITAEASTSYESGSSLDEAWRRCVTPSNLQRPELACLCFAPSTQLAFPCWTECLVSNPLRTHSALWRLMDALPAEQRACTASIAIDGTSATTLLIDGDTGEVLAAPRMYNEAQPAEAVARAKALAPPDHTATASTSTLCKVLAWDGEGTWQAAAAAGRSPAFAHQADWVAGLLHGQWRVTDYNNALKLGFDPAEECYPEWLADQVGLTAAGPRCPAVLPGLA